MTNILQLISYHLYSNHDHPLPTVWPSFTYSMTILYLFHDHPLPIPWPSYTIPWPPFTYSVTILYLFRDPSLPLWPDRLLIVTHHLHPSWPPFTSIVTTLYLLLHWIWLWSVLLALQCLHLYGTFSLLGSSTFFCRVFLRLAWDGTLDGGSSLIWGSHSPGGSTVTLSRNSSMPAIRSPRLRAL